MSWATALRPARAPAGPRPSTTSTRVGSQGLPAAAAATLKALASQFARGGTEGIENPQVFETPEVTKAGGLAASEALGRPAESSERRRNGCSRREAQTFHFPLGSSYPDKCLETGVMPTSVPTSGPFGVDRLLRGGRAGLAGHGKRKTNRGKAPERYKLGSARSQKRISSTIRCANASCQSSGV